MPDSVCDPSGDLDVGLRGVCTKKHAQILEAGQPEASDRSRLVVIERSGLSPPLQIRELINVRPFAADLPSHSRDASQCICAALMIVIKHPLDKYICGSVFFHFAIQIQYRSNVGTLALEAIEARNDEAIIISIE